jgi:hypothetical protein
LDRKIDKLVQILHRNDEVSMAGAGAAIDAAMLKGPVDSLRFGEGAVETFDAFERGDYIEGTRGVAKGVQRACNIFVIVGGVAQAGKQALSSLAKSSASGEVYAGAARLAPIEVTRPGERFVRLGAEPRNLRWTFEHPGGVAPGTHAVPEEVFNQIGQDPSRLKDLLDLPGRPPTVYSILEPPAGTPIQRGVVPGGEYGGQGGLPEVLFPEGF